MSVERAREHAAARCSPHGAVLFPSCGRHSARARGRGTDRRKRTRYSVETTSDDIVVTRRLTIYIYIAIIYKEQTKPENKREMERQTEREKEREKHDEGSERHTGRQREKEEGEKKDRKRERERTHFTRSEGCARSARLDG